METMFPCPIRNQVLRIKKILEVEKNDIKKIQNKQHNTHNRLQIQTQRSPKEKSKPQQKN
jgi:hypothetical protein